MVNIINNKIFKMISHRHSPKYLHNKLDLHLGQNKLNTNPS